MSTIADDLAALAVPIDTLHLMPGNPRIGDVGAIARSLNAFGQRKPLTARRDGTITTGNHTWVAARTLGWDRIAVVWCDDTDDVARAWSLSDNKTSELGSYNDEALVAMLTSVHNTDPNLYLATGWTDTELRDLLASLEPERPRATDDAPPVPVVPTTRPGDVWLLGDHRLVCGDATDPQTIARLLDGGLADLVWTDPPYGLSYVGKTPNAMTIENDDLSTIDLAALVSRAFDVALTATRPGAVWFVAAPPGPQLPMFMAALNERDIWRQSLIWLKDQFVLGHSDYHYRFEMLLYGWSPGAAHQPTPDRTQDNVWEIPRPTRSDEHPTMKPVELIARALRNHTHRNALVLDPFTGSGSTLVACEQEGRQARCIEIDPGYCDVTVHRWQLLTGLLATRNGVEHDFSQDAT